MYIIREVTRRVWRYQREVIRICISTQTTQWPKENKQKDKQRSTKHTYKTKDRVTQTTLKNGDELRCSGRAGVPAPLVTPSPSWTSVISCAFHLLPLSELMGIILLAEFHLLHLTVFTSKILQAEFWLVNYCVVYKLNM
jgi:hypothetical protein